MAKIILVPNLVGRHGPAKTFRPPLGLISLATVLRDDGCDVEIFDLDRLEPTSTQEMVCQAIMAREPEIVGFSTMCSTYLTSLKLAQGCKSLDPAVKIILGGPQATITAEATLALFPFVDVIARGECEQNITTIMRALATGGPLAAIPGLHYRAGATIVSTPALPPISDLDEIPLPDYGLCPNLTAHQRLPIEVGRGCPFQCTFCCTNDFWGRKYRLRSSDRQIALFRQLQSEHGFREFVFEHDNFTVSKAKVIELCRAIRQAELNINWRCDSRIDTLDAELIQEMAAAGCTGIYMGIETGSPRIQKLIKKNLDLSHAVETVRQVLAAGINITASFILGFPQETLEDLLQTIDLMLRLKFAGPRFVNIFLFMLAPTPLTELYAEYASSLRFDGNLSVIAHTRLTDADRELVRQHPEIFAAYHYFDTPHLSRDFLLRTHYFLDHVLLSPDTLRMLWEDRELRFPMRFLEQLSRLEAPTLDSYHSDEHFLKVRDFISAVLRESGYGDHPVHGVLRREVSVARMLRSSLGRDVAIAPARSMGSG